MERMEINGIIWDCRLMAIAFFGYMPVSAIVRLCRNIAKVEVKRTAAIILPGVHQEQQREASQPEPVWQSEELQLI